MSRVSQNGVAGTRATWMCSPYGRESGSERVKCPTIYAAKLSIAQFAKISDDIRFKIKVPNRRATKQDSVNHRTPHDTLTNQIKGTEDSRVNDNQSEDCNYNVT